MPAELKSASHGATLVLTLSNPEQRNAMSQAVYAAGVEALHAADANPEVRSIVITGEGAHFCAGGDLQTLLARRQQPREVQAASVDALHAWVEAIRTFPKPVIAAVEGAAAGAGFSLALACDFIIAAENAFFVMAYSNVALSPDGGSSWALSRALPRQLVSELLMAGERITPQRLHQLGVVNQLAPAQAALTQALALAERLNARAPNALASIKELMNEAATAPLEAQLRRERDHFVDNLHHPNGGVGIQAFLDRKTPRYG